MSAPKLLIIGGGLAGLSAGCYGRANGFETTIVEHNLTPGGVCTAWHRGAYLVDGCIHWLTGGPFLHVYEELGIVPAVPLRTLEEFVTYRHVAGGWQVTVRRELARTLDELLALAPEDADELKRVFDGVDHIVAVTPPVTRAPELAGAGERLRDLWRMRHDLGTLAHFWKPLAVWVREDLQSERLRALFTHLVPPEAPALFLLMVLGYLSRGWLSRPEGGTTAFRDALVERYRALGGRLMLNTTVEEVIVNDGRARGVRVTDGTILEADAVVSTSSAPETVFRLLAGRYGAREWQQRMDRWKLVQPIVLATFGVEHPLEGQPGMYFVDGIEPFTVGSRINDFLYLRTYHDDPAFAPPGHGLVQALVQTDYDWWATRAAEYQREKDLAAELIVGQIDRYLPGVAEAVRMVDVATPVTFWRSARAWRGAFEGWLPTSSAFTHLSKQLPGLDRFYMAGQWVEPGGGVPMVTMSGRHVVEIICDAFGRPFVPTPATAAEPA